MFVESIGRAEKLTRHRSIFLTSAIILGILLSSLLWIVSNSSEALALDPSNVYESDMPIPLLLQKYAGSELLGRPTDRSIVVNIIAASGMEAFIEYGLVSGNYIQKSQTFTSLNGEPIEILINSLSPNTRYYYRNNFKLLGSLEFAKGPEHSFFTQRASDATFTFDLQADPHMDANSDPSVYNRTLQAEAYDRPDFIIDLGDTFMTEKFAANQEQVDRRYIETRAFLDIPGGSSPVFLVNGNHEGEFGWVFSSANQSNNAYWAIKARKLYYPNPYPDGFYTGSLSQDPIVGLHENYYSWSWGNALFVVLDPYTYSNDFKRTGTMWDSTIGNEQYQWFKKTLESSNATYKFVFEHHVLAEFRGMTTWADKFEWGGYNDKGVWEFDQLRPNWTLPLHQLMVKNNVNIFFQGHDHLFCQEIKDGVVYQEVPQPSAQTRADNPDPTIAGNYTGQVFPSSGYLRVQVSPQNVSVEYIRIGPPESAGTPVRYSIQPETQPPAIPEQLSWTLLSLIICVTFCFVVLKSVNSKSGKSKSLRHMLEKPTV